MNGKQLKNSILQWAIQGKLVPQDPNDEPASVLLEKIRAEKARLVKEGKLKKKDLEVKPIAEDEIPFEIPSSWAWCRLSDISACELGKALDAVRNTGEYVDYLTGINVYWNRFDFSQTRKMRMTDVEYNKYHLNKGDLVVCEGGDAGRCAVWKSDKPIAFQKALHRVRLYNRSCPDFYMYLMMVYQDSNVLEPYITGTTIKHLTNVQLRNLVVPFPPLAEQHRIVAKIEELMPLVEKYGSAQENLDEWNQALPEKLKKSILQEAIQGKLVPQDSHDEPASALLERIREEKKRLVKEGKLKKKDLEVKPIEEDEVPFEIPKGWKCVRLKDICQLNDGEKKNEPYICMDAKFLRGKKSGEIVGSGKYVQKGDHIILVDGENSGEVFTAPCDGYMGSTFKQLWISDEMYLPYVLYFIRFYKELLRNSKKGAAIPHLNKEIFYSLTIGIPPLAEQRRIVAKIEELFGVIG